MSPSLSWKLSENFKSSTFPKLTNSLPKATVLSFWTASLVGLHFSLLSLPLEFILRLYFSEGISIALSLLGIYAAVDLIDAVARWHEKQVVVKKEVGLTSRLLRLLRVATLVAGGVMAMLVILDFLGIELTPVRSWMGEHGWRIALIVVLSMSVVLVAGQFIPKLIVATVARRPGEPEEAVKKRVATLSRVLVNTAQVVVFFVVTLMVLAELKINITPILAGVGIAGQFLFKSTL